VFLDTECSGFDGFSVCQGRMEIGCHSVFVTAYQEYAIRAFEANAAKFHSMKPSMSISWVCQWWNVRVSDCRKTPAEEAINLMNVLAE
jgi:hypothetical protein